MNMGAAARFILDTGHPLEKSLYRYYFEGGSKAGVIKELSAFQNDDGGFNINWKWYTSYEAEFEEAKKMWRPRITLEKMIFFAGLAQSI